MITFLSPKQSEIEESSLESIAKDVRTRRLDTPSEGGGTSGIAHSTRMSHIRNSSPPTFHPDISHPALDAGWERRAFQLPRSDISGSSNSIPGEFHSHFAQCHGVLLKLPNMSNRHFEIFCFRYLMSKSPNSPCNPPIIGFLSY